ncbi:MAG: hypothetical protein A3C58_03385 [Candidatus Staskawiczbacteria bacterium RIFCSPHIGHO2_02_FULL_34_10]|uniref:Methyltransferase type 11 domain-containing protein n=2 Tax=Candidatus Staskawicziibacteriota TaxID=1817916 RepID=A0A1G2HMZ0_9BACT|nr:MAG: hypothetical protein A2639_02330 [Candidatus Staskawiczbacteria bacterium RIFCSPHIGHO2_01_FULL_34_27]OGZ66098.1 MAG: hypothetical protein A3C58_03385 [Candidatus Staskawiczbacteria bacterium RIFCSPHIGHO2_02_FULL_34_10]
MTNANIDYWNKILKNPIPTYKQLLIKEDEYLKKHIAKNSSVLDIGCSNGRNIETMLSVTKNITGIDIEESAVLKTQDKFKTIPTVKILKGSVFNLPFPDKSFDIAVLMCTLVNFENKKTEALKEMKRVIKDSGKLIISVYAKDALKNRLEQYKKINLPIKEISDKKVIFENILEAGTSEQFSISDIKELGKDIDIKVENLEKVPEIAYIFEFIKS